MVRKWRGLELREKKCEAQVRKERQRDGDPENEIR